MGSLLTGASAEPGVQDDCGGEGLFLTRVISPTLSVFQFLLAVGHGMRRIFENVASYSYGYTGGID
jgi:hypothetical protein